MNGRPDPVRAVEEIARQEWGRVLSVLVGHVRDFQLAEDVLQDSVIAALATWPDSGVPKSPAAWLLTVARRKAIDHFRRRANFEAKRAELEVLLDLESHVSDEEVEEIQDDRLRLVFTCCHPALSTEARVALTLKTLGGLRTTEIARAFVVTEETIAQRIVRAKRKIRDAGIPYAVPGPALWGERLDSVLAVLYFIFNEGYAATSGEILTRAGLCQEAMRLAGIVAQLIPEEPEVAGLLALMKLHDARRPARTDSKGAMVSLEFQDRAVWDQHEIANALQLLKSALNQRRPGPYQIQAAISALHSEAINFEQTDWPQITALYGTLYELQPTPIVMLNGIVALSFARGAKVALTKMKDLERSGALNNYQPYHAARADILRRAGQPREAADAYEKAIAMTTNASERAFLLGTLSTLK